MQNDKTISSKVNIGLVQIACSTIDGSNFLPYSIGLLQSYCSTYSTNASLLNFLQPIIVERNISKAIQTLSKADIIAFSTYIWNGSISLKIAEAIKNINPKVIIIFGGPYIPFHAEEFLRKNNFIDLVVHGEGEEAFSIFLEKYFDKDWSYIPGVRFIDNSDCYQERINSKRIRDIDRIPSPYFNGVFEHLIESDSNNNWVGVFETNRGCPYRCSFCEWGNASTQKLRKFSIERIYDEINWFAQKHFKLLFCCDSNFGIFERDKNIAEYIASKKRNTGYPSLISVQNAKNSTNRIFDIHKCFIDAGLLTAIGISFQSLNEGTLQNIKRTNIKIESFKTLQKLINSLGESSYCELILGLPGETYESFVTGISELLENGYPGSIRVNNLTILPNSEMANESYRKKYGLRTIESIIVNPGQKPLDDINDTYEMQELVFATNSMSSEDWIKTRIFSYMLSLTYFEKLLYFPMLVYNKIYSISFRDMIESILFSNENYPTLKYIYNLFYEHALSIQQGKAEYIYSQEYLGVFWPVNRYLFLKLLLDKKLESFYNEFRCSINKHLSKKHQHVSDELINSAFILNREIIKNNNHPIDYSKTVSVKYDFVAFSNNIRHGINNSVINKETYYTIASNQNKRNVKVNSIDVFCHDVLNGGIVYGIKNV